MKRRTTGLLAAALLAVLLLAGCGTRPLPSGMEEEAVGQAGQEIVEMLVARDYQGVVDAFRPDIAEELGVTLASHCRDGRIRVLSRSERVTG